MNKFTFALIAVITLHLAVSEDKLCPLYKCMDTKDDKCMNTTIADGLTTIEVKKCADVTKYCKSEDGKTGNCVAKEKAKGLIAGDACESNDQCLSNKCENKKCSSAPTGGNCTSHYECEKGNFCDTDGTCKAQLSSGGDCKNKDEFSCPNDEGCLDGKCTKYYSLTKGTKSDKAEFCQSSFIYTTTNGTSVCAEKILNSTECKNDTHTCDYEIDTAEETKSKIALACVCKLIDSDKKYCPVGTNDEHYKEAVKIQQDVVAKAAKLHTLKRGKSEDYDLGKKYIVNLAYPVYEGASDCIIDGVLNGMNYLKISFFGLMLFGLLF